MCGLPTIWSCLAAHVAVLHLDGIERRELARKLAGLVECANAMPPSVDGEDTEILAHSAFALQRIAGSALAAHGYQIFSRSRDAGADIFAKEAGAPPPILFQGHPEYEPDTLLRQYRRDVGAFVSSMRENYPDVPAGYFSLLYGHAYVYNLGLVDSQAFVI